MKKGIIHSWNKVTLKKKQNAETMLGLFAIRMIAISTFKPFPFWFMKFDMTETLGIKAKQEEAVVRAKGGTESAAGKGVGKEHANPAGEKMFKIRPLDGDRM